MAGSARDAGKTTDQYVEAGSCCPPSLVVVAKQLRRVANAADCCDALG
jgi:hypothetical protein